MDPDETLSEIRAQLVLLNSSTTQDERAEHAMAVAEGFEALDEWITRGGFLPIAWTTAPRNERR